MNISSVSLNRESTPRKNLFIKYSNSFMSMIDNPNNVIDKTKVNKNIEENNLTKTMGIETLTIFPKQVIDGRTIITA